MAPQHYIEIENYILMNKGVQEVERNAQEFRNTLNFSRFRLAVHKTQTAGMMPSSLRQEVTHI